MIKCDRCGTLNHSNEPKCIQCGAAIASGNSLVRAIAGFFRRYAPTDYYASAPSEPARSVPIVRLRRIINICFVSMLAIGIIGGITGDIGGVRLVLPRDQTTAIRWRLAPLLAADRDEALNIASAIKDNVTSGAQSAAAFGGDVLDTMPIRGEVVTDKFEALDYKREKTIGFITIKDFFSVKLPYYIDAAGGRIRNLTGGR